MTPPSYIFPSHYPNGCPPQCGETPGEYFRVVKNGNKSDLKHFKSYYDLGKDPKNFPTTDPCDFRAVSVCSDRERAVSLMKQFPSLGRYIAYLALKGGHGVVQNDGNPPGHCNWWVAESVDANRFCTNIEGPL